MNSLKSEWKVRYSNNIGPFSSWKCTVFINTTTGKQEVYTIKLQIPLKKKNNLPSSEPLQPKKFQVAVCIILGKLISGIRDIPLSIFILRFLTLFQQFTTSDWELLLFPSNAVCFCSVSVSGRWEWAALREKQLTAGGEKLYWGGLRKQLILTKPKLDSPCLGS